MNLNVKNSWLIFAWMQGTNGIGQREFEVNRNQEQGSRTWTESPIKRKTWTGGTRRTRNSPENTAKQWQRTELKEKRRRMNPPKQSMPQWFRTQTKLFLSVTFFCFLFPLFFKKFPRCFFSPKSRSSSFSSFSFPKIPPFKYCTLPLYNVKRVNSHRVFVERLCGVSACVC